MMTAALRIPAAKPGSQSPHRNTSFTVGRAGTFPMSHGHWLPLRPLLGENQHYPAVAATDNNNGTAGLAGTPVAGSGRMYTVTAANSIAPRCHANLATYQ